MHDVQRQVNSVRDGDNPVRGLSFDLARARERVPLGPEHALLHEPLLVVLDEVAVLRVHHDDGTEFFAALEDLQHAFVVVEEVRAFVSHEELERRDATLHDIFHLSGDLRVPVGYRTVQGVIAVHFLISTRPPVIVSMHKSLFGGYDKVDEAGGTACNGCLCALVEIVHSGGAHEGQLQVHVRINTTWHNELASRIKHFIKVPTRMQLICGVVHALNLVSLNHDIGFELAVSVHDGTILDKVRCEGLVLGCGDLFGLVKH